MQGVNFAFSYKNNNRKLIELNLSYKQTTTLTVVQREGDEKKTETEKGNFIN